MQLWLIELIKGFLFLFLNPLFYASFIVALALGYFRVKRERRQFYTRLEPGLFEMKAMFQGILVGLILSVVTGLLGIVAPIGLIYFVIVFTLFFCLFLETGCLSPVYTVGLSILSIYLIKRYGLDLPILKLDVDRLDNLYPGMAVLIGLLTIAEGVLIYRRGYQSTSPQLAKGKRGLTIGIHIAKKFWVLPVLLFIPVEKLSSPFEWWPIFVIGGSKWMPIFVPFLLGFNMKIRSGPAKEIISKTAMKIIFLGLVVTIVAFTGLYDYRFALLVIVAAFIGRIFIEILYVIKEKQASAFIAAGTEGLQILAVIPNSPAERMGLETGDIVTKINGTKIFKHDDIYKAMQTNAAYCKLEVLDMHGELRIAQTSLYEGDHYSLGIINPEFKRVKNE